jgi:hypothetical protein
MSDEHKQHRDTVAYYEARMEADPEYVPTAEETRQLALARRALAPRTRRLASGGWTCELSHRWAESGLWSVTAWRTGTEFDGQRSVAGGLASEAEAEAAALAFLADPPPWPPEDLTTV